MQSNVRDRIDPLNCMILAMSLMHSNPSQSPPGSIIIESIQVEKFALSHVPFSRQCLVAKRPGAASGSKRNKFLIYQKLLEKLYLD